MIFPFGIRMSLDKEILSLVDNNWPTFDMSIGTQGISDTFSFCITPDIQTIKSSKQLKISSAKYLSLVRRRSSNKKEIFELPAYS